ncbi:MAG: carboxypeptidase regulatory-like domain-containing protein [Bryobacteraceae bacterium]
MRCPQSVRFCFITALLFSTVVSLSAQTIDTATISGQVFDSSRAPLQGVQITLRNSKTGSVRAGATNGEGRISFTGLPVAGTYRLTASKEGFLDVTYPGPAEGNLALNAGTAATFTLQLDVAGKTTEVTVTGVTGEVRTDQPQLGIQLSAQRILETPLLNRRITYLPLLNAANRPAINQGDIFLNQNLFTTNGSGRRQTSFGIDGATGNDSWGRQTLFTSLPLAAVQEMDVLTNSFSAEYGGSSGSFVNLITKSGGDDFHGEVLALGRPDALGAALSGFTATNAPNGNALTSDKLLQGSVSLSGPIAGHTQFFVAGEGSLQDRVSPVISPLAPGNFVGKYRGFLGTLRLDHQFSDRNSLFFRSSVDNFYDTNPNGTVGGNSLPNVARTFRRRTYSEELGQTAVFSPTLVNNLRLQFQLGSPITQFDPAINSTQYIVPISAGGTFTSGTSQSALLMNRQYQVNDTISATRGPHHVKFGGDVLYARNGGNSKEFGGPIYLGQFTYNTCTLSLAVCESPAFLNSITNVRSYTQSYGNANYTVSDTLWALFVQDDFRVRSDLTVNLGLRYERQTFTDAGKNFAPRAGFAYNWRGEGKTVIRGGVGLYYSQIIDNSQANYALSGPTGVFNYTAGPGQVGFPTSVAAAPLPAFPSGAIAPVRNVYIRPGESAYLNQFFPTSTLVNYPYKLLNPYSEQWTFGVEQQLGKQWVLSVDYVGSHTVKINRPLDVNPPSPFIRTAPNQIRSPQAANCTRPYWLDWYRQRNLACNTVTATNPQPPYGLIQSDVNNGYAYYHAFDLNLSHRFSRRLSMLASYTWSHAIDNVDPDVPGQSPNDPNFTARVENGRAIFDQRQRFVLSGTYALPFKVNFGGIAIFGSGLPYNIVTGTANSGDTGGTTDRPVINGVVVGRNTGRGRPTYEVSPFLERPFALRHERIVVNLRAEAFNILNHANFIGYSGTYGNGAAPGTGFGQPTVGITGQLPARSFQFSGRVTF